MHFEFEKRIWRRCIANWYFSDILNFPNTLCTTIDGGVTFRWSNQQPTGSSVIKRSSTRFHIGSYSVTCHLKLVNSPSLNPSQTGWYSVYLPPGGIIFVPLTICIDQTRRALVIVLPCYGALEIVGVIIIIIMEG